MTMQTRPDGSRYPDDAEQRKVLADFTDPDAQTGPGHEFNRTLGDLIVDVLAGRDVLEGITGSPDDTESFEHAMLQRIAVELRAVNQALASSIASDGHPADPFTTEHAFEYLRGLARRVEAGAELAERLRNARWGHPSFGGGEAELARQRAALRNRVAKADETNGAGS